MIMAHFILEAIETNIKFTEKYYNVSKLFFVSMDILCNKKDESNLEQM